MASLTANAAMNYTDMNKKGLWTRFKKYLAENQQTIFAGMTMISGNYHYAYFRTLGK